MQHNKLLYLSLGRISKGFQFGVIKCHASERKGLCVRTQPTCTKSNHHGQPAGKIFWLLIVWPHHVRTQRHMRPDVGTVWDASGPYSNVRPDAWTVTSGRSLEKSFLQLTGMRVRTHWVLRPDVLAEFCCLNCLIFLKLKQTSQSEW